MPAKAVASYGSGATISRSRAPGAVSPAIAMFCVALFAATATAQEMASPLRTADQPHRFFDGPNIALTVAEAAALTADGIYTQHLLKDYAFLGAREGDPIARVFVERGWPGQIVGAALFIGADVGLRYVLHRKKHHKIERLVPLILTAYGAYGAIHNARALHRARQH